MADYKLSGIWVNGERLLFDDARLQTLDHVPAATWTLDIEGAHDLRRRPDERVEVKMATGDGHEVEGEARVMDPGRHNEATKLYFGVRFEGLTPLHELR
jgi:hypothetical protein